MTRSAARERPRELNEVAASPKIDLIIATLMAAMLAFLPFAFGTVQPWSQEIFFIVSTLLILAVIYSASRDPANPIRWHWVFVPILLFICLASAQLFTWPVRIVSAISPHTTAFRSSLLADQPNAIDVLSRQSFTFYPQATEENLRLVLAVSGVFFAVTQFYRTRQRIEHLLLTIAAVGCGVALLAIGQNLTDADKIYGLVPMGHRNSGPFMNYSHFSQFMNLSIGASIGSGLMRWMEVMRETRAPMGTLTDVQRFLGSKRMRVVNLLACGVVIQAVALIFSMSRMGIISLIAAGCITGMLIFWRTRSRDQGSVVLILGLLVLMVLLCVGFDAIYDRLATVQHIEVVEGGRTEMLRDMAAVIKLFPIAGTGLGTHEYVFPMFNHSTRVGLATHAENEFAQLLEESGIVGLFLALLFLAIIARSFWLCIRQPKQPVQYAAFGLGYGLIAIIIHSFSDFGQHAPANAVLTACSAGLILSIARIRPRNADKTIKPVVHLRTDLQVRRLALLTTAFSIVVLLTGAWCITAANAARLAEDAWNTALTAAFTLHADHWQGTDAEYIQLLKPATLATQLQPQNVKYRYELNAYRWRSLSRDTAKGDGKMFQLRRAAVPLVAKVVDDLIAAQNLCPTYGPNFSLAGKLEHFVLNKPQGIQLIQTGFRLNPNDATAGFIAGEVALDEHRWNEAFEFFQRATQRGGDKLDAINQLVNKADQPALAYQLAGSDPAALQYLLNLIKDRPQDQQITEKCQATLQSAVIAAANQPDASADALAALANQYLSQGDKPNAITYLRKALVQDYSRVDWHYQLANLLADTGDPQGGMSEARVCLSLRPEMKDAETLLANLRAKIPAPSVQ